MRLEKYLNEKFVDAHYGGDVEIFINPTSRELRDLKNVYGYRFFIDFKKKNLIIFQQELFHRSAMDTKAGKYLDFDWYKYWAGTEKAIEYIFMGDCNDYFKDVNSDALWDLETEVDPDDEIYESLLEKLKVLASHNYSWLKKYGFNPKEIKDVVLKVIHTLEMKEKMRIPF